MATKSWIGGLAAAVAQVSTGSIDSVDGTPANNTFTVTIKGVAVSVAGNTDVNTTATALRAALNASTHPYFAAVTWSGSGGNITGTADLAGLPFLAVLSVSGAGTGTVTDFADSTPSAGPHHWSSAANWSPPAVPVNGDDVVLKDGSVDILWGLNQDAVTLASFLKHMSYTGKIGLPHNAYTTNEAGTTYNSALPEPRQDALKIKVSGVVDLERNLAPVLAAGSSRLKLDFSSQATTIKVHNSARASADSGLPAIRIRANSSSTDLFVLSAPGGVGVASEVPGETSTLRLISISDQSTASRVFVSKGVTLTTYKQIGGNNYLDTILAGTLATCEVWGGRLQIEGDYTITALAVNGGTVIDNHIKTSGNAVTAATINGGVLDLLQSNQPRTLASVVLNKGVFKRDTAIVTVTALTQSASVQRTLTAA